MRRRLGSGPCGVALAVGLLLSAARAPAAEDASAADEAGAGADDTAVKDTDYGHGLQFGARVAIVGGYRMVFGYDSSPLCAPLDGSIDDAQKFCGHMGPPALDVALSFAPFDALEPFLWGRFGLSEEEQTNTANLLVIGAGLRLYTMPDAQFKIFVEPSLGLELEGQGSGDPDLNPNYLGEPADYGTDLVLRMAAGPQFELARYVGIYAEAGLAVGMLRYIHATLEFGGGLQFRGP